MLRLLRKLYAKLHLRVNEKKTEVGSVFGRKFLGYSLRGWSGEAVKISVAPGRLQRSSSVLGNHPTCWWAWHGSNRRATWKILAGLEELLPSCTNSNNASGPGFMDSPTAQGSSAQTVEAWHHDISEASRAWRFPRGGSTGCSRRPTLVALQ